MSTWSQVGAALLALGIAASPSLAQKPQGKPAGQGKPAAQAQARGNAGGAKAQRQGRGNAGGTKAQAQGRGNAGGTKAQAQGRGNGGSAKAQAQGRGNAAKAKASQGQGRGNSGAVRASRGNADRGAPGKARGRVTAAEVRASRDRLPQSFRELGRSDRMAGAFVAGAAAYGLARGLAPEALQLRRVDDRLVVRNRQDELLFDMDEDRASRLGVWNLRLLGDQEPRAGAPAFCRSGEGHPVWGREWCLEKGFGLGRSNDRLWSRTRVEDIIFGRRIERDRLDRGSLIDVLGDVVFGRLALHALALGFDQPLVGYYTAEPQAPQILRVRAGTEPVAEMVDLDRDGRVDVLYVTHYGY